jgi:hypothetical protein
MAGTEPQQDPFGRNWGVFVFNEKPRSHLVIETPHTRSDWNSELLGVEGFEKGDAMALFMSGANRFAINHPDRDGDALADVAHRHAPAPGGDHLESAFEAAHLAYVAATKEAKIVSPVVQFHGFNKMEHCPTCAEPINGNIVVSSGGTTRNFMANGVATALGAACSPSNPCDQPLSVDSKTTSLHATTNLQRETAPFFVHVESNELVRGDGSATPGEPVPRKQGLLLARTVAYATEDHAGGVERALLPTGTASVDRLCLLARTLIGLDMNSIPEPNDLNLSYNAPSLDTTMLDFAHKKGVTWAALQIDSPYLPTITPDHHWSGFAASGESFLHRERLTRAGLYVLPIFMSDPTFVDGRADAERAVDQAILDGYPSGVTLFLDDELSTDWTTSSQQRGYVTAWFQHFTTYASSKGMNYLPGIYCSTLACDTIKADLGTDGESVAYWAYNDNCDADGDYQGSPGCVLPKKGTPEYSTLLSQLNPANTGSRAASIWQYAQDLEGVPDFGVELKGCEKDRGYDYASSGVSSCNPSVTGDYAAFKAPSDLNALAVCGGYTGGSDPYIVMPPLPPRYVDRPFTFDGVYATLHDCAETVAAGGTCYREGVAQELGVDLSLIDDWMNARVAGAAQVIDDRVLTDAVYDTPLLDTPVIHNGDFQSDLHDWDFDGDVRVDTVASVAPDGNHDEGPAAKLTAAGGDSMLAQRLVLPVNTTLLTFRYSVSCGGGSSSLEVAVADNTVGATLAVLPATCTGDDTIVAWPAAAVAGHDVTLTFTAHDGATAFVRAVFAL